jgi:hypothetical protein
MAKFKENQADQDTFLKIGEGKSNTVLRGMVAEVTT